MKRILWFRRDLRIDDNSLLSLGGEVLPIFIFDTNILSKLPKGDKRVSFIFSQVLHLKEALKEKGLELKLFYGNPIDIFINLSREGFDEVAASGDYDSYARKRDLEVSHILPFNAINDTYIFQPNEILKADKTPYLVFTPFYNRAKTLFNQKHLHEYQFVKQDLYRTDYAGILEYTQTKDKLHTIDITSIGFEKMPLAITESHEKLATLEKKLENYKHNRDFPCLDSTSHLSFELRFGTLSIRQVLRYLSKQKNKGIDTEPFFRQLIFRDYYAYLLYHFPHLETENYKYTFKGIDDISKYKSFTQAKTGVPIIDAGVRELLQTGDMHNRVRMICASFFTKDLLLPWQWGEKFFAQYLLDYDAASNILSWQWSAGTGVDPQPYFRIFNPYLQSKKFDSKALYIKRWLPELNMIDAKIIHNESTLLKQQITGYPQPIVNHMFASKQALEYFKYSLIKTKKKHVTSNFYLDASQALVQSKDK